MKRMVQQYPDALRDMLVRADEAARGMDTVADEKCPPGHVRLCTQSPRCPRTQLTCRWTRSSTRTPMADSM